MEQYWHSLILKIGVCEIMDSFSFAFLCTGRIWLLMPLLSDATSQALMDDVILYVGQSAD